MYGSEGRFGLNTNVDIDKLKTNTMSERDAKNRADLDRLLQGFRGVADSQTFALIEEYANFKKATSTVETAIVNVRLVTTVLTEMGMQEPISVLKVRDPENGQRKVFKEGVSSMVLPDLTRKDIRAYFGNLPRFGKTSDKSYKAPLWDLLTWLGREETTKKAQKKWDHLAGAIGEWGDSIRDASLPTLTPEHVEKLLDSITRGHCFTPARDEVLIALLWEAGFRPYELLELRIGDVGKSPRGPNVTAITVSSLRAEHGHMLARGEGKKKIHPRTVELWESTPYLARWLKEHPNRDNPDALLFPSVSNNNPKGMLTKSYLSKMLQKAREGAGITDVPTFAYRFRTSRITYVLRMKLMTIDEATDYFGTGITVIQKHYRRVTGDMVNANYISNFQPNGEEVTPQHLSAKACPECNKSIPPQSRSCPHCDTLLLPTFGKARDSTLSELMRLMADTDSKELRQLLLKGYEDLSAQGPKEETAEPAPEGKLPEALERLLSMDEVNE